MTENEPVAWMDKRTSKCVVFINTPPSDDWIPLYTHPEKTEDEGKVCARCGAIAYDPVITQTAKTLTDEEIQPLLDRIQNYLELGGLFNPECMEHEKVKDLIMDCKAILRKAQEK